MRSFIKQNKRRNSNDTENTTLLGPPNLTLPLLSSTSHNSVNINTANNPLNNSPTKKSLNTLKNFLKSKPSFSNLELGLRGKKSFSNLDYTTINSNTNSNTNTNTNGNSNTNTNTNTNINTGSNANILANAGIGGNLLPGFAVLQRDKEKDNEKENEKESVRDKEKEKHEDWLAPPTTIQGTIVHDWSVNNSPISLTQSREHRKPILVDSTMNYSYESDKDHNSTSKLKSSGSLISSKTSSQKDDKTVMFLIQSNSSNSSYGGECDNNNDNGNNNQFDDDNVSSDSDFSFKTTGRNTSIRYYKSLEQLEKEGNMSEEKNARDHFLDFIDGCENIEDFEYDMNGIDYEDMEDETDDLFNRKLFDDLDGEDEHSNSNNKEFPSTGLELDLDFSNNEFTSTGLDLDSDVNNNDLENYDDNFDGYLNEINELDGESNPVQSNKILKPDKPKQEEENINQLLKQLQIGTEKPKIKQKVEPPAKKTIRPRSLKYHQLKPNTFPSENLEFLSKRYSWIPNDDKLNVFGYDDSLDEINCIPGDYYEDKSNVKSNNEKIKLNGKTITLYRRPEKDRNLKEKIDNDLDFVGRNKSQTSLKEPKNGLFLNTICE